MRFVGFTNAKNTFVKNVGVFFYHIHFSCMRKHQKQITRSLITITK